MAASADFLVDLQTTLRFSSVIRPEDAIKRPVLFRKLYAT
jgi:hypothetical protein